MNSGPDHEWIAHDRRFAVDFPAGCARMEGVDLDQVAKEVGTPTFVYSASAITHRYRSLAEAVGRKRTSICYAVKANSAQAVLRHLCRLGAGADIVSGGELTRALEAGMAPGDIVFSGVGKQTDEIDAAIEAGVRSINVESPGELDRIAARALALGKSVRVALRINPDVDPVTHPYLATGLRESKFGIAMEDAFELAMAAHRAPGLELAGLACHIGSQIVETSPFEHSFARLGDLARGLGERGVALAHIDVGGGFGIAYKGGDRELDVAAWGRAVIDACADLPLDLIIEPGRFLVGNAGVLLTRVIGRKQGEARSFIIVDAAMNDLLRPSLYGAYHVIVPARLPAGGTSAEVVDVVGPICESGDFLARDRPMAPTAEGDLLVVLSAGAYGMTMASSYNTRPLAAEVFVDGDRWAVIRRRKSVADLLRDESYPDWLI
jgi:diaminopimelate decarboxylase